jgi:hypothetical protein
MPQRSRFYRYEVSDDLPRLQRRYGVLCARRFCHHHGAL